MFRALRAEWFRVLCRVLGRRGLGFKLKVFQLRGLGLYSRVGLSGLGCYLGV